MIDSCMRGCIGKNICIYMAIDLITLYSLLLSLSPFFQSSQFLWYEYLKSGGSNYILSGISLSSYSSSCRYWSISIYSSPFYNTQFWSLYSSFSSQLSPFYIWFSQCSHSHCDPHLLLEAKHIQYFFKHWDFLQLQAITIFTGFFVWHWVFDFNRPFCFY